MGYPVVNQTAPDTPGTVLCPGCVKLVLQISNQAVLITFGQGAGQPLWGDPEPYLPVVGVLAQEFDAFKFQAFTPVAQLPPGATQAYIIAIPR
jgi:hypothetical protein